MFKKVRQQFLSKRTVLETLMVTYSLLFLVVAFGKMLSLHSLSFYEGLTQPSQMIKNLETFGGGLLKKRSIKVGSFGLL